MLKIETRPLFDMPVQVNTRALRGTFTVTFVAKPDDELEALQKAADQNPKAWLAHVVEGFQDVELPDGKLDGTKPASLVKLLTWPGVAPAMVNAYFRGMWEEAEKNSEPPLAG